MLVIYHFESFNILSAIKKSRVCFSNHLVKPIIIGSFMVFFLTVKQRWRCNAKNCEK